MCSPRSLYDEAMRQTSANHPVRLDELIPDAVRVALKVGRAEEFLEWMRTVLPHYVAPGAEDSLFQGSAQRKNAVAMDLGRFIWNAMPLPENNFKPRPLPEPGRNDPCFCGSGQKYKHCCGGVKTAMKPLPPDTLLPYVLQNLSQKEIKEAMAQGQLAFRSAAGAAIGFLDQGEAKIALLLLEPWFTQELKHKGEDAGEALYLLCNLYEEMGQPAKKEKLLLKVVDKAGRTPLGSAANQRLAAIHMDKGDHERSWAFCRQAMEADPGALDVGFLEVQLLVAQSRYDEAKERAGFWLRKMERHGAGTANPEAMAFLREMASNPLQAMIRFATRNDGPAMTGLQELLAGLNERSVPRYSLTTEPTVDLDGDDGLEGLKHRLRSMGIAEEQIDQAAAQMEEQMRQIHAAQMEESGGAEVGEEDGPLEEEPEPPQHTLVTPPELKNLESAWREVFPLSKPFSVNWQPHDDVDIWEPKLLEKWVGFLEDHSQALDNLSILDDLGTACLRHPDAGGAWFDEPFLFPVVERACRIVLDAVHLLDPAPQMPWAFAQNRPALRALMQAMHVYLRHGTAEEALFIMLWLLKLNPGDNHGVRALAVNRLLREGRNEEALEIANRYGEDDHMADVCYGRVLALFRLNRLDEAQAVLEDTMKDFPLVPHYLIAKRPTKPPMDPHGYRPGGPDQAWMYREEMRDVWEQTPGTLAWLKKMV